MWRSCCDFVWLSAILWRSDTVTASQSDSRALSHADRLAGRLVGRSIGRSVGWRPVGQWVSRSVIRSVVCLIVVSSLTHRMGHKSPQVTTHLVEDSWVSPCLQQAQHNRHMARMCRQVQRCVARLHARYTRTHFPASVLGQICSSEHCSS